MVFIGIAQNLNFKDVVKFDFLKSNVFDPTEKV